MQKGQGKFGKFGHKDSDKKGESKHGFRSGQSESKDGDRGDRRSGKRGQFPQQGGQRDIEAEGKFKFCKSFNFSKCTRDKCFFKHMCAECGSADHGERDHPKV